jgi:uncharacterized membrane protein YraQ (UPF0718 family)
MRMEVGIKPARVPYTTFVPLLFVAALIAYKWNAAGIAIQKVRSTGVMLARPEVVAFGGYTAQDAFERTLNYFLVIWPALVFGILISAAVRAFVPSDWFARRLSGGKMSTQVLSGMAGAPLMLCSCCVVSVFSSVYERSSRLGPSIAIMLGSPALNPAALILTFLLFSPDIAIARLLMAAPAVFWSGLMIEELFPNCSAAFALQKEYTPLNFSRALMDVVIRTIPLLILGVIASMLLIEYLPSDLLASHSFRSLAVIATASIAVPIALPTFFEIPLALGLIAAGAPAGAAAALLFAGPVINLPSLFALAKLTNWKIAASLAGLIWVLAVVGGLVLNQILI